MSDVRVKLDTEALDKFSANLGMNTDQALKATAFQVEAHAKAEHTFSNVTGALESGIHTDKIRDSLYWVADSVEYGVWVELGTSIMSARPFMLPAVEAAARDIARAIEREYS